MSSTPSKHVAFAAAHLDPKGQTLEGIQRIVQSILNHVGCGACGRIARLRIDLLGDPPADLAKENVLSFEVGEIRHG